MKHRSPKEATRLVKIDAAILIGIMEERSSSERFLFDKSTLLLDLQMAQCKGEPDKQGRQTTYSYYAFPIKI